MSPDFVSSNRGSIVVLTALNPIALDWVDRNIDKECDFFGQLHIDHRMFPDIAADLLADGFTLQDAATGRMAALPLA